jgi:hypothetical protein
LSIIAEVELKSSPLAIRPVAFFFFFFGSIHQIDKDSIGFTATMIDKSPDGSTKSLTLVASDLTCVNN